MCHETWRPGSPARPVPAPVAVADGGPMPASSFGPEGEAGDPVVLVPDIYGPSPFYEEIAQRLAHAGHPTLLVDHHFREGDLPERTREGAFERRSRMREPRALDDIRSAIDAVRRDDRPVGVLGFCLGGQFALVLAATEPGLRVVSYYGFPEGLAEPVVEPAPRPIDLVPQIDSPVLAFWGDEDYIPLSVVRRYADSAAAAERPVTVQVYEGAGHSFLQGLVETRPDSAAAEDSWDRTLAFLAGPSA
jgi:carboxymethylenebutenolidase